MPETEFDPALIDAWASMWNTYDVSMVERLFLDDERVTYFSSEKRGLIRGIEALLRHHKEFGFVRGGKDQPNGLWLEDTRIEAFGDAVIVKADWCFRRGVSEKVQRGPVTLVYVPSEDGHRIAHAHFSNY
jgi:ketosteroid isomerase-like protein